MSQALKVRFINFVGFDVVIFFTARIRLYHSETTPLAAARFVDSTRSPIPRTPGPPSRKHLPSYVGRQEKTSQKARSTVRTPRARMSSSTACTRRAGKVRVLAKELGSSCIISEGDSVNPLRRDTGERRRSRSDGSCRGHPRCAHFR